MTRLFWQDLAERAGKTFVQGILAVLTVQGVSSALEVNWPDALAVSGTAALVSVLTSLLSFLQVSVTRAPHRRPPPSCWTSVATTPPRRSER